LIRSRTTRHDAPQYRVNLTLESAGQLEEIFDYIEAQSPQNAPRVIRRLLDAIFSLEQLPHRFKVVRNTSAVGERPSDQCLCRHSWCATTWTRRDSW